MGVMNLLAGQQWRHRHRERTCGHRRGRRGWDERRQQVETCTLPYVKERASGNGLCDSGSSSQYSVTT